MFKFEACEVLKIKEFAFANDCFQNKHNEEVGHYGQPLFNNNLICDFFFRAPKIKVNKKANKKHCVFKSSRIMKLFLLKY